MSTVKTLQTPLGVLLQADSVLVFFGNARGTAEELNKRLPNPIRFLKQVHGDHVVECRETMGETPSADAQWTSLKDLPLGIVTADCLPILGFNIQAGRLCAIHAGWRGVAQQIPAKAVQHAQALAEKTAAWSFWIGPHIHTESFEVGRDVAQEILKSGVACDWTSGQQWLQPHADPEKIYIDLCSIVKLQLERAGVSRVQQIPINTYTDLDYCSYRRSGKGAGRNISWILHASDPEKVVHEFQHPI